VEQRRFFALHDTLIAMSEQFSSIALLIPEQLVGSKGGFQQLVTRLG
jgi:hypothetical protein